MKIKMDQRNVRIDAFTCRKVVRCLEDNCRWQHHQLWSPPASSTASSPSPPSPPSSSSPSLSLSNPFSLDHPFFQRHYFRIRSSFYHPPASAFHQPSLPVLRSIFRQRVTLGRTRGVTTLFNAGEFSGFQDFGFHFGYIRTASSCYFSFIVFNISGCLSGSLLNHFGFEDD